MSTEVKEEKKEEEKFIPSDYSCQMILEDTTLEKSRDPKFPSDAFNVTYVVEGNEASIYTSGATALDATFTLNSQNPLIPVPAIDPDYPVPVVEPYHLCKYLIKAF